MDIYVLLDRIAVLFTLMALGFLLGKTQILTKEGNKTLSKLVLFIAFPGVILGSVLTGDMGVTISNAIQFLLMAFLVFAISFTVAIIIVRLLGGDKSNRGLYILMSVFSNCAFMGLPVVITIFGAPGIYYVALFSIPFTTLVFSVGILLIAGRKKGEGGLVAKFNPKVLLNPTLIAAILSIPIAISGVRPPNFITESLVLIGYLATPGGMFVIGASLAYVPVKTLFSEWRIIPVSLIRLVVIPVVTWLILRQILSNELMLGVLVVLSAMPVAATASTLSIEYDGNEQLASSGVFLSTLLCAVTLPLIVYFLLN